MAVIGLGQASLQDHIPAVLGCDSTVLDSVCDSNGGVMRSLQERYCVAGFQDVRELVASQKPDLAIVAIPHFQHFEVLQELAAAGVSCLKEKPFAMSLHEASQISGVMRNSGTHLQITTPKRYDPLFRRAKELLPSIGRPVHFRMDYARNILDLSEGWRAARSMAGGGCLIDMGYHIVDLALWFFGVPQSVSAYLSGGNREEQVYDVEDTCSLRLGYPKRDQGGSRLYGELFISRVSAKRMDRIQILGTQGQLELDGDELKLWDRAGRLTESATRARGDRETAHHQIEEFAHWMLHGITPSVPRFDYHHNHVSVIDAAYRSHDLQQREIQIQGLPE